MQSCSAGTLRPGSGCDVFAFETKIAGADLQAAQKLAHCAHDAGARQFWIISQAKGTEPLVPGVTRRGFDETIAWLPA